MHTQLTNRPSTLTAILAAILLTLTVTTQLNAQPADPLSGTWELSQRLGDRQVTSTVTITGNPNNYTARLQTNRGETNLNNLTLNNNTVTFTRSLNRGNTQTQTTFTGTLNPATSTITGSFDFRPNLTVTLTRTAAAESPNSPLRFNTVGYLPNATKQASIPFPFDSFTIVNALTNQTAFTAQPSAPKLNPDTNEQLYTADFTTLSTPGSYKLVIEGQEPSDPFTISDSAFNPALKLAIEAMYLWRCGTDVHGTHQGDTFQHAACHLHDALGDHAGLAPNTKVDTTGGWHDAGDYNKYVSNAGVTVGVMLLAYQHFPSALASLQLNIPEANNQLPDYLDELKFELDWLLKMQRPDGAVYHKVSTLNFGGFIMPENETTPRYLASPSSIATADFAAM